MRTYKLLNIVNAVREIDQRRALEPQGTMSQRDRDTHILIEVEVSMRDIENIRFICE